MKKGFALLETIIVITFLTVSLLLLYSTFTGMVKNSKRNSLYDDASNIYKVYYIKEYLSKYGLLNEITEEKVKEITCSNFSSEGCITLLEKLKINKMYMIKKDFKGYQENLYSSSLNNYLASLSNNQEEENYLVIEMMEGNQISYAKIGINGDTNE